MQQEILAKDPSPQIRVYAVWLSYYPWDSRSDIDSSLLSDRRVAQFWDGDKVTGRWFAEQIQGNRGIAWDVYFLFGPEARWDATPPPLVASGSPVIARADQLRSELASRPHSKSRPGLPAGKLATGDERKV